MTEKELIDRVSKATGAVATKAHIKAIVGASFEEITKALARGDDFSYSGFGRFYPAQTRERKGRNPKTGEEIVIPAKKVARFRPGKVLRDSI